MENNLKVEGKLEEVPKPSFLKKTWGFLSERKIWWMTPLVIFLLLLLLASLARQSTPIANIYAPV